jgi:hypothetical protein
MRPSIKDEFTALPISRQRKWQLRRAKEGRCEKCGEPAAFGTRCLKHLIQSREKQRKKHRLRHRYKGALSYRLEARQKARRESHSAKPTTRSVGL